MKKIDRSLIALLLIYSFMHGVLIFLHDEKQVFWYVYTGLLLFSSLGYVFYERNIESKRLFQSIGTGLIAAFIIVFIYTVLLQFHQTITFNGLLREMIKMGVYFKWQLIITLIVAIPLHELYMRALLQDRIMQYIHPIAAIIITSVMSTALFSYAIPLNTIIMIFIVQLVISISYVYTKRLITPIMGEICAIVLLIMIFGR
ncbi:type II CAAX prenyl endopeptidase Rce1 family protein [Macrococcus armenti]|uniref:CPBP family glutamic-type intramembrane protease n=1 Tax=Macrococcus armenti TaxID=2875764 RepID=UPI001CC9AA76|nr:CPBP family intramembrane glutamic endopeptidase [Macrococcus armenti]UBH09326.1 CPBP family intramembrane metalloprotease [Macrococcus armenti]UBH11624.1 CPBP family intramembrane metalloprotease [Macrococcus armenti]